MPTSSPALHLVLPGLLWPAQTMQDLVFDLKLPALSWLLGKGRTEFTPVASSQQWLAGVAGLPQLPAAALRVATQSQEQTGRWLCLDPIHLRVERTQLIVEDPSNLHLSLDEAVDLISDLAPVLEELGTLHIASPHEWHIHLHDAAPTRTTALADAVGLNGEQLMPQADNSRLWRRLLNEVQMTLHEHPVNAARQKRGLPPVNSLWPWGEGQLQLDTQDKPDWDVIQTDSSLWQGFAQYLGFKHAPLPASYAGCSGKTLVIQPALAASASQHDAMRWRIALQDLEAQWFVPLMQDVQSGKLKALVLHGHGEDHAFRAEITHGDRLRFWRKPAAITTLGVGDIRPADAAPAA